MSDDMDWNDLAEERLPALSSGAWRSLYSTTATNRQSEGKTPSGSILRASPREALPWNARGTGATVMPSAERESSLPRRYETLQEMVARHEQEIMDEIIETTTDSVRRKNEELIEAQMQKIWEQEREKWIKDIIGNRSIGSSASNDKENRRITAGQTPEGQQLALITNTPSVMDHGTPLESQRILPTTSPFRTIPHPATLNPQSSQRHLEIIQAMQNPEHTTQAFIRMTSHAANSPLEQGYATAWQLVAQIVHSYRKTPVDLAMATLIHFCKQVQELVAERVRSASLNGQDIQVNIHYENHLASQCASFCKLIHGDATPWATLYYCVRCGDAVAALQVWENSTSLHSYGEENVRRILTVIADRQGNNACFWEAGMPRISGDDQRIVADLMMNARNADVPDIHQIGFYTLLSGADLIPSAEGTPGFGTIEDYLTGGIWKALMQPNPVEELTQLSATIQSYGSQYFGGSEAGGWSYAIPLLATQQYRTALFHLANVGENVGILQAAHLALVLLSAGVSISDLEDSSDVAVSKQAGNDLLVAYANHLLSDATLGSLAALEYIGRIPDRTRARQETAALIAKTLDIDRLVGTIDHDGRRQSSKSSLDKLFSPDDITFILSETAALLLQEGYDRDRTLNALKCYMLAGRFSHVLDLLNQLIAPPNEPGEDRTFWLHQTELVHSSFLSERTYVLSVLERDRKMSLIDASATLVKLNSFFVATKERRFEVARSIVADLHLLPASTAEMAAKENQYRSMDPVLKKAIPAYVADVMETLFQEHCRLKDDFQGGSASVTRERLKELQTMAHVLVNFVGTVGINLEDKESFLRKEALMV